MTEPGPTLLHQLNYDLFIDAAPATVWGLWVEPAGLCTWWGTSAELDPRPGGVFRVVMGDGGPVMSGSYVELDPVERLVFRFGWEGGEAGVAPGSTQVEVTLVPERGGTRLTLRHTELPTAEAATRHREGWDHFLGELARAVTEAAGA